MRAPELLLGGGGASHPLWRQLLASVLGRPLLVLPDANVSAIGAALLSGLAIGAYSDHDVEALGLATNHVEAIEPEEDNEAYAEAYLRYVELYACRTE